MRIGYARVSTDDQTLDLQRDALKQAKCRQIYEEHASGKNANRPELDACLKSLREGDTLVVWRLDQLGRSLADLIRLTNELQSRGIELESLTEKIETASPTGKLVFHVFGALSEFERNLIRERTMAGLKAARARGRKGGRPRKLQAKEMKTIRALLKTADISVQEVAARFGVSDPHFTGISWRNLTLAMSFREIIAELPNLTEDEKRELFGLLAQQLSQHEESPEFLAMLKARIDAADRGTHRYTLAETRQALQSSVKRSGQ